MAEAIKTSSPYVDAGMKIATSLLEQGYSYIRSDNPYGNYIIGPDEAITDETLPVVDFVHGLGFFAEKGFFGDDQDADLNLQFLTDTVIASMKIEQRLNQAGGRAK